MAQLLPLCSNCQFPHIKPLLKGYGGFSPGCWHPACFSFLFSLAKTVFAWSNLMPQWPPGMFSQTSRPCFGGGAIWYYILNPSSPPPEIPLSQASPSNLQVFPNSKVGNPTEKVPDTAEHWLWNKQCSSANRKRLRRRQEANSSLLLQIISDGGSFNSWKFLPRKYFCPLRCYGTQIELFFSKAPLWEQQWKACSVLVLWDSADQSEPLPLPMTLPRAEGSWAFSALLQIWLMGDFSVWAVWKEIKKINPVHHVQLSR